ncbi:venom protein 164-like [Uloborus diversus]|uniref:venom protein 164-like n=1 Tax=Uloborus diversus TaxID=327109 RepID=UPI00240A4B91|nr:venom protein 164-like [Uloborus diversus]
MKLSLVALLLLSCTALTFGKRCRTFNDCEKTECCVSYSFFPALGGCCKRLRNEGESCSLVTRGRNEISRYQCPCKEGLTCKAQKEFKLGHNTFPCRTECVMTKDPDDNEIPEPDVE